MEGRGWCKAHYSRYLRHGDPLAGRVPNGALFEFIEKVAIPFTGADCLDWPFGKMPNGYGSVKAEGKTQMPHVIICTAAHGPRPDAEHEAAHSCGNRACVNPSHLRWKTSRENALERHGHGTMLRGERHPWAKLCERDVLEIRALEGTAKAPPIARRYGVSPDLVRLIWRGTIWSHVTGHVGK